MKNILLTIIVLIGICIVELTAIPRFYLLTVGESKEPYAMYGHTAIRVADSSLNMDFIVDWGVFNFNQPNFYINFARGKMYYSTSTELYEHFVLYNYFQDKGVVSREILLNNQQKERLWMLISRNLEPENRDYYYKFIRDNCATRPRDLLEQTLGQDIIYPEVEPKLTFRDILHQYQQVNLWYNLLIDIILGSPIDKVAGFREQMFIPEYLEKNLSETLVRDSVVHYLLGKPEVIVEKTTLRRTPRLLAPETFFLFLLFVILILDYLGKGKRFLRFFDLILFSVLILLGILIMALWGLTEHQEAYNNYNLFWLNPLFILPMFALLSAKGKKSWLLITGGYVAVFGILAALGIFPQAFPITMYIILAIILERCYFGWKAKRELQ